MEPDQVLAPETLRSAPPELMPLEVMLFPGVNRSDSATVIPPDNSRAAPTFAIEVPEVRVSVEAT